MALVKQHAGVTPRFGNQTTSSAAQPGVVRRALATCRQGARELTNLVRDEIAYATIDTLRVVVWLRYQLHLDRPVYKAPLQALPEREPLAAEPARERRRLAAKRV